VIQSLLIRRKRMLLQQKEMEMNLTNRELGRLFEDLAARTRKLLSFVDESGDVKDKEGFANYASALRGLLIYQPEDQETD
jgi:hypothetical protein